MKTSTVCLLCIAFVIQTVVAQRRKNLNTDITIMIEQNEDFGILTGTAQNTVISVINHIVFMLRDGNSSTALVKIAEDFKEVMTSQEGQNNSMALLNLVGFLLKDENASKIISLLCDQALTLVTTDKGREVTKEFILSLNRVMELDKVPKAAQALVNGINTYLTTLTPEELDAGLNLFKDTFSNYASA